jgi:hypothetical protein
VTTVQIIAIEGNTDASSISAALIEEAKEHLGFEVDLKVVNHVFENFDNAEAELAEYYDASKYDFVMTSKMINELISTVSEGTLNAYSGFVSAFSPLLKDAGLLLMLDITSKPELIDAFVPQLMNIQVNEELRKKTGFKTILPVPCGQYEELCQRNCFTQKNYYVSHSQKSRDKSKVCFRVIARTAFATEISECAGKSRYVVVDERNDCCPYSTTNSQQAVDGLSFSASPSIGSKVIDVTESIAIDTDRQDTLAVLDESALDYAHRLIKNAVHATTVVGFELLDEQGNVASEAETVMGNRKNCIHVTSPE